MKSCGHLNLRVNKSSFIGSQPGALVKQTLTLVTSLCESGGTAHARTAAGVGSLPGMPRDSRCPSFLVIQVLGSGNLSGGRSLICTSFPCTAVKYPGKHPISGFMPQGA